MGTNVTEFSANARVYMLLDDWWVPNPTVNTDKTLYKVRHFVSVTSKLSVDGGGSAQVVFNDMDMKFWKYLQWKYVHSREWGNEKLSNNKNSMNLIESLINQQEISDFRKHLEKYGANSDALKALKTISGSDGLGGGLLVPIVTPQNLIWIHYMGRDGYWYAGFTGVISNISINETKKKTPVFTVNATTPDSFFANSQIAIRKALTFGTAKEQLKLDESENLAYTNVFNGQIASEVIVNTLDKVNKFFLYNKEEDKEKDDVGEVVDYRYFKVRKLFGFGADIGDTTSNGIESVKQEGEFGYDIDNKIFENKRWNYDDTLDSSQDFYNGVEVRKKDGTIVNKTEGDWLQVAMDKFFYDSGDKVKPFQNLIATNIQLFTVDKMTAKEVLDVVKKTVFCYMYFRGDGTFVVERPYFDIHLGMLDSSIEQNELPPDYDMRYLITKLDVSYLSHNYSEDSSRIVTRTEMEVQPDWIKFAPQVSAPIKNIGKSESSWKTTFKFGEKQVQLNSIVSPKYAQANSELKDKIFSSYCYAMRMLLSCDYRSISLELDQRPDIQLNRNMLFLDLGLYFVTKDITQTFNPQQHSLRTSVVGTYARPVGFSLVNPYRFIINSDGSLSDWEKVSKYQDLSLTSTFGLSTEKNNPLEVKPDGETFNSIETYAREKYNSLDNYNSESGKSFDDLFLSTGSEKRPYIICFRGLNSSHQERQDFYDDLYLMLPETGEYKKINSAMSCGDAQTAGTVISQVEDNYFLDNKERPAFHQYTQLADGIFRYYRLGNYWVCKDFKYYDLYSDFSIDGDSKNNGTVSVLSSISGKRVLVDYLSYMGADCHMSYNQRSSANSIILNMAEPKGKWWEGVNIFPAENSRDNWEEIISNISGSFVDVFVINYNANDEQTLKSGMRSENLESSPLNLSEPQKLFYNLKFLQSNFGELSSQQAWISNIPKEYSKTRIYGNVDSPKGYFGLYNVSDDMIGYTNDKDLKEFKNVSSIEVAIGKQHVWGSAYYSKLTDLLNSPLSQLGGYSLNALYDLASQLHVNNVYQVRKIVNDGSTLSLNYPLKNSAVGNTFLSGNRGALIALLHIYLQQFYFSKSYTGYGDTELYNFVTNTDEFFDWTELAVNYVALDNNSEVEFSNLASDEVEVGWINPYFLAGVPSNKISYLKFLKLFYDRVVV